MTQFPFREPVGILYLPEEDVREGRWVSALGGAFDFLHLVSAGRPTSETLDDNLVRFCEFVRYTGQVHNGGHGQYLDNCRPSLSTLDKLNADIDRLRSPNYAVIVADLVRVVRALPAGKDHTDGSFTGCDLLAPLDQRYFALWHSDPIERHMVLFLTRQPWVRLSPQQKIAASGQAIRNLRQLKRKVTMPSAEEIGRFVEFNRRLFGAKTGSK